MSGTRPADSKQSEKDYLRRAGAGAWERLKPFSPEGTNTLAESAGLMQDFAAAISHLPPSPTDRILDLGAGACWCSDWLQRLNLRTVAVDISWDMLRVGRDRLPHPGAAALVAGDLERLPFATDSFDKAYCLSAIHHVPDIRQALREIHRVLTSEGAVLFSEPGIGHADKPASVTAMRDFGVLEQDIVPSAFVLACQDAGFADVRIKPLSYLNPAVDLTADEWHLWQRLAASKRPARAGRKLWHAILELVGAGKRDVLFENAFAMVVVRVLRSAIEDHPVIVASKAPRAHARPSRHRARIRVADAPGTAGRGDTIRLVVDVTNLGPAEWPTEASAGSGQVRLGLQLLAADHRLLDRDFHREPIREGPIASGRRITCRVSCRVPAEPGQYLLKVDLVAEGVTWFEVEGSEIAVVPIVVQ